MKNDAGISLSYEEKKLLREILQSELFAVKRAAAVVSDLYKAEMRRREAIINGLFRLAFRLPCFKNLGLIDHRF